MAVSTPVNTGYTIINGTTTGSNGSKVNTWVEYKITGQDVATNTSTIRVVLYSQATFDSGTGHVVTGNYGYVKIDSSQQYYSMSGGYNFENKKLNKFADYTFTVTHGTDGKKTVTIGGAWSDIKSDGKPYSTYISGGSVSASVTLPQIARASTISNLSTTLGTSGTITITRQDTTFRHTLQYSFDNTNWTNIATGIVAASYSWAPSVDLISSFSNSKTKTGYLRCITYTSANSQVGTKTSTLTLTAPSSSLANVTGTYGTALTLTATNACASGLTYTFQYHNGSEWTSIASGVTGKTRSWTPATSLIANVDNASTGTVSIRVITYVGTATVNTASATATLTIPKNTSSARSGTIGSALSIPITKAHSKLTSTITYSFGNQSNVQIVNKTTSTSYSWTPATSLLTEIPSATSGVGTIKIESFNGNISLGSNTYNLTLAVADNVIPTISFDAPVRVNSNATVESWGIYLQGYSAVKVKLRANGVSGSTISRMSITGQGISSASTPGTSSPYLETTSSIFGAAGTFSYTGAATDSRGRSASEARSSNVVVQAYSSPSVSNTRIVRCNSDGTENTAGTSLKVTLNSSYTQVGQNAFTAHLQYKSPGDASWTTVTATAIDPTRANVFNLGLSIDQIYYTRIRYSDSLSGYQYTTEITVPSDERIINVNASGKGLAIGGFSTEPSTFQEYYPARFADIVRADIRKFDSRQESADLSRESKGGMSHFLATSTMTDGKPPYDSHIIQMDWDDANGGDAQLAIRNNNPLGMWIRTNGTGSYTSKWFPVGHQVTENSQFAIEGTSAQIGNIGDGWCYYSKATYSGSHSELLPSDWGILEFHGSGSDWYEIWHSQPNGHLYYRGGNGSNQPPNVDWVMIPAWDDIVVKMFNDTSGSDWKAMLKNKVDYVRTYGASGKTYIMQGGWAGQTYGYSIIYWTNSYVVCDFYGLNNRHWRCVYDGSNYSYYRLSEDGSNDYTYNGLTIRARRRGSTCDIYVTGTTTSAIETSGAAVTLCTLPEIYRPMYSYVNLVFMQANLMGQLNITTAGAVNLGYTHTVTTSANASLASGTSIWARVTYAVQ